MCAGAPNGLVRSGSPLDAMSFQMSADRVLVSAVSTAGRAPCNSGEARQRSRGHRGMQRRRGELLEAYVRG